MPWLLKVQVPQNQCQVQLFPLHRYSTAHAASLSQPYMAALPCPLYIYHFRWPISWQLSEFWVPVWNFLLYMVKGTRECCVWKRCSEFSQICGGKSANLKLPHKIKLSWINLQHSLLGDILNNVLFKAFLLCFFPGLAVPPLTQSFDQQTFYCLTPNLLLSLCWITALSCPRPGCALMNWLQSFWKVRYYKNKAFPFKFRGTALWTIQELSTVKPLGMLWDQFLIKRAPGHTP